MSDLLTNELVMAAQNHVRAFFAQRRKLGQVPVDERQFSFIQQIVGRYDTLTTPRIDMDISDLREMAQEKLVSVDALVCARLDQQCRDLDYHFGMLCEPGNRLLFTLTPQAHLVREHFTLKMYIWTHVCVVEPKEPPACPMPTASPESAASPTG